MGNNMNNPFESPVPTSHAVPNGELNPNEAKPTHTVFVDGEPREVFFTPTVQEVAGLAIDAAQDE